MSKYGTRSSRTELLVVQCLSNLWLCKSHPQQTCVWFANFARAPCGGRSLPSPQTLTSREIPKTEPLKAGMDWLKAGRGREVGKVGLSLPPHLTTTFAPFFTPKTELREWIRARKGRCVCVWKKTCCLSSILETQKEVEVDGKSIAMNILKWKQEYKILLTGEARERSFLFFCWTSKLFT